MASNADAKVAKGMNYIVLSDLTSGLVAGVNAYLHHTGHMGMQAGEQFLASVVGRWVASYSAKAGLNFAVRDAIGVFVTRALLAMLWNERRWGVAAFDSVLADRVGLLVASLFSQESLPAFLTEQNIYQGAVTGPVGGQQDS